MALDNAWVFIKGKGKKEKFVQSPRQYRESAKRGHSRNYTSFREPHYFDADKHEEAMKRMRDTLTDDLDSVNTAGTGINWPSHHTHYHDLHSHIDHSFMRAQMRLHAIRANNYEHPSLHLDYGAGDRGKGLASDKWFYNPKYMNHAHDEVSGFDSPSGGLFDDGASLDMMHRESSPDLYRVGGDHHQEYLPKGLGAQRPPNLEGIWRAQPGHLIGQEPKEGGGWRKPTDDELAQSYDHRID